VVYTSPFIIPPGIVEIKVPKENIFP